MRKVHDFRNTSSAHQLVGRVVDAVGAGCFDPKDPGPVVVTIELVGRTISGTYHRCEAIELDVVSTEEIIWNDRALKPFVIALLERGTPFVTETGCHDTVCTLRWTIT